MMDLKGRKKDTKSKSKTLDKPSKMPSTKQSKLPSKLPNQLPTQLPTKLPTKLPHIYTDSQLPVNRVYHSLDSSDSGIFDLSEEDQVAPAAVSASMKRAAFRNHSKSAQSANMLEKLVVWRLDKSENNCLIPRQRSFRLDSFENLHSVSLHKEHVTKSLVTALRSQSLGKRHSQPANFGSSVTATKVLQKRHSQPTTSALTTSRLVVLGAGGVGKSALIQQFIHGSFSDSYTPTVQDSHTHLVQLPGGLVQPVDIVDTAGLYQFPAMRRLSIQSGHAFIVVYAVDSEESYQEALELVALIQEIKNKQNPGTYEQINCWPIMVVGNKLDLGSESRRVEAERAEAALRDKSCYSVEVSAKENTNVDKVFTELLVILFGVVNVLEGLETSRRGSASLQSLRDKPCTIL